MEAEWKDSTASAVHGEHPMAARDWPQHPRFGCGTSLFLHADGRTTSFCRYSLNWAKKKEKGPQKMVKRTTTTVGKCGGQTRHGDWKAPVCARTAQMAGTWNKGGGEVTRFVRLRACCRQLSPFCCCCCCAGCDSFSRLDALARGACDLICRRRREESSI